MKWLLDLYINERTDLYRLNTESRFLIKSIILFNSVLPVLSIFLTAFLLRYTQSQTMVGVFHIFLFAGVLLGFYANGLLLRKYPSNILLIAGLITEGLIFSLLIFFPAQNLFYICFFGLIYGLSVGLYWANRNYLTLITTQSSNRIYFSSLESVSKSISDIITPFLIGAFLTGVTALTIFSTHDGYKILSIAMLFILGTASIIAFRIKTPVKKVHIFIRHTSENWRIFRFYNFALGFITIGVILLPPLMVLRLVGEEGALGVFQGAVSLISACVVYGVAKSLDTKNRLKLLTTSVAIGLSGIAIYSITYSPIGVFAFMAGVALSQPFWWTHMSSMSYDLIERSDPEKHYAGLCDRELYINFGRITSIVSFIILIFLFSDDAALRFMPLIFAIFQIIVYFTAKSIEKSHSNK